MYSKATLSLAVLAVARLALAQPYCLLTAVNTFEFPADQKTLCCAKADKVEAAIKSDLCPSSMQAAALSAFKTACADSGHEVGSCKDSSSSSSSASSSASASVSSAPYPVVFTSTYYDEECTCTKTKTVSSSAIAGSTGFATGTAAYATGTSAPSALAGSGSSSPAATGSPIAPATPSSTGSGSGKSSSFKGAASKNSGSVLVGLLVIAGIALAL